MTRRSTLKVLGLAPLAAALGWTNGGIERATSYVAGLGESAEAAPASKFFTAHEWPTVRMLADYIIPRDKRSGSATEAKAPEFIDFMMMDETTSESSRVGMRGGLAWLDTESRTRFGKRFIAASDAQRRQILDDIAWPKKARPEMSVGVAFFNRFRDAVASAFFSSAMGWKDLQYIGNTFNPNWNGCPKRALDKLGVSYEEFDASLAAHR
ncbi:MAG: gluconate 2-dehydrogenase subunit 3 family protein, partial [Gemmatimonadaceae bacterium]|nr:gluconate 2-dehydrogenase subunit 3 family protein [Gemmatimonadaceae bacterium]